MRMSNTKNQMSVEELRGILEGLDLRVLDLAVLSGASRRAAQKWALGESPVPSAVAYLFRVLANHPELLPEVWEYAGMPGGRKAGKPGRPRVDVG